MVIRKLRWTRVFVYETVREKKQHDDFEGFADDDDSHSDGTRNACGAVQQVSLFPERRSSCKHYDVSAGTVAKILWEP